MHPLHDSETLISPWLTIQPRLLAIYSIEVSSFRSVKSVLYWNHFLSLLWIVVVVGVSLNEEFY